MAKVAADFDLEIAEMLTTIRTGLELRILYTECPLGGNSWTSTKYIKKSGYSLLSPV